MCVMIEKYVKMTGRGSCGDNVTFEREGLCNLIGEKMDSCLLQKGQHQMVQWSIRQLELMFEDILKSSLIGWGFWDKVIGRFTIVMRSNAGFWSIKGTIFSGF